MLAHPGLAWRLYFLLSLLSAGAQAEPFTGKVYRAGEPHESPVFMLKREEFPQADGSVRIVGEYVAADASVVLKDEALVSGGNFKKYTLEQNQTQEWGTLDVRGDKIHFEWRKGPEVQTGDEDRPGRLVVGATTVDFLKAHWPEILEGKDVDFRFGVLDRQETIGFKFFKTGEEKRRGQEAVVVRMKPTSVFVNAVVDPIYFVMEKKSVRLIELKGKIGLKERDGKSWKDFDSEIEYFYNHAQTPRYRLLNRDGSFNIVRLGMRRRPGADLYHSLLSVRWKRFFGFVFLFYMGVNLAYAFSYFFFGSLQGAAPSGLARFQDCFFFSVQTLATIGYGRISPIGVISNLLVTLEALNGLLGFAIVTGLLFARFSRPTARVIFSSRALLAPHDGVPSLMFRIVNARASQIAEAQISVGLVINETTREGETYRTIHDLKLERERTAIFAASWMVVHPIDASSPLHGQTRESLDQAEAEILVSVTGIDETFAQTIHARYSYIPSEIAWNASFEDMLSRTDGGKLLIDVGRLNQLRGEAIAREGIPSRP